MWQGRLMGERLPDRRSADVHEKVGVQIRKATTAATLATASKPQMTV